MIRTPTAGPPRRADTPAPCGSSTLRPNSIGSTPAMFWCAACSSPSGRCCFPCRCGGHRLRRNPVQPANRRPRMRRPLSCCYWHGHNIAAGRPTGHCRRDERDCGGRQMSARSVTEAPPSGFSMRYRRPTSSTQPQLGIIDQLALGSQDAVRDSLRIRSVDDRAPAHYAHRPWRVSARTNPAVTPSGRRSTDRDQGGPPSVAAS